LPAAERERAQHALAQDFFKAGLFDRAEAAYRALAGTVYALEAELALLSLYERSRDWARAAEVAASLETRGAGSFASRRAHYLCELALAAHAADERIQAQALLSQAMELAPAHARARVLQGQWAQQTGDAAGAFAAFAALLAVNPVAFNLIADDYAKAAEATGQQSDAVAAMQARYAQEPSLALVLAMNRLEPEQASERLTAHLSRLPSLNAARHLLSLQGEPVEPGVLKAIDNAAKPLMRHRCAACGFEAAHYFWQCPGCLSWDSFPPRPVEEL
jgi:lipopolysaccharide biosynthesis regulator YciM